MTGQSKLYNHLLARGLEHVRAAAEATKAYGYEPAFSPEVTAKNYIWTDERGPGDDAKWLEWSRCPVGGYYAETRLIKRDLQGGVLRSRPVSAFGVTTPDRSLLLLGNRWEFPRPVVTGVVSRGIDDVPAEIRLSVPIIVGLVSAVGDENADMLNVVVLDGWRRIGEMARVFESDLKLHNPDAYYNSGFRPAVYLPAIVLTPSETRRYLS